MDLEFKKLFNLGDYQNEAIGIKITLPDEIGNELIETGKSERLDKAFLLIKRQVELYHIACERLAIVEQDVQNVLDSSDYIKRKIDAAKEMISNQLSQINLIDKNLHKTE
jgi:exonuclease VII small subunit